MNKTIRPTKVRFRVYLPVDGGNILEQGTSWRGSLQYVAASCKGVHAGYLALGK